MSEKDKGRPAEGANQLTRDEAREIIGLLNQMDMPTWYQLAKTIVPSVALVKLAQTAEEPPTHGSEEPQDQELVMFTFGQIPPSRRVVEVARHIATNPEVAKRFDMIAMPLIINREKQAVDDNVLILKRMTQAHVDASSKKKPN